jgi:hypothetical protein
MKLGAGRVRLQPRSLIDVGRTHFSDRDVLARNRFLRSLYDRQISRRPSDFPGESGSKRPRLSGPRSCPVPVPETFPGLADRERHRCDVRGHFRCVARPVRQLPPYREGFAVRPVVAPTGHGGEITHVEFSPDTDSNMLL